MKHHTPSRRSFLLSSLTTTSAAFLVLPALGTPGLGSTFVSDPAPPDPCRTAGPEARFALPGERGVPMRVTGRVFRPDGRTAAAGIVVYGWQTDARGEYHGPFSRTPRLRGWMKTDADGRFAFDSIRPAPYPGRTIPAHVHFAVWGPEVPPQFPPELLFDDDPHLAAEERRQSAARGAFANVRSGKAGADGVLRVDLAIRLETTGDRFEENVRHALAPCGL